MDWARMLAYVTGTVDQELLARNEYLAAENRIMKAQLKGRLKLSDTERGVLGEIGHRLGRKFLADVANRAAPFRQRYRRSRQTPLVVVLAGRNALRLSGHRRLFETQRTSTASRPRGIVTPSLAIAVIK